MHHLSFCNFIVFCTKALSDVFKAVEFHILPKLQKHKKAQKGQISHFKGLIVPNSMITLEQSSNHETY